MILVHFSRRYIFCCRVKIAWYIVLIVYHACDVCLHWYNYHKLYEDKTVSGVSLLTTTDVGEYENAFRFSCLTGTVFSIIMAVAVYGYYIYYYWDCIRHANYRSVSSCECEHSSLIGVRGCDKRCNRHFVTLGTLELLFKDDIQSIILYFLFNSQSIVNRPSWYFIAFSVCSVCAQLKLCICFMSKFCGCGSGEKSSGCNDDCSCVKAFVCVIGFICSAVFLVLTVVRLVDIVSV